MFFSWRSLSRGTNCVEELLMTRAHWHLGATLRKPEHLLEVERARALAKVVLGLAPLLGEPELRHGRLRATLVLGRLNRLERREISGVSSVRLLELPVLPRSPLLRLEGARDCLVCCRPPILQPRIEGGCSGNRRGSSPPTRASSCHDHSVTTISHILTAVVRAKNHHHE